MDQEYLSLMAPWHRLDESGSELSEEIGKPEQSYFEKTDGLSTIKAAHQQLMQELSAQLLGYVYAQSHVFFEKLIIDLLLAMGYGGRRRDLAKRIGGSGDGGVDGVIAMDALGLDVIYMQAKRLRPSTAVPVSAVRDFVGSLESKHASKGIFVTTAHFSAASTKVVEAISKKVILIDGHQLSNLMVKHNVGTMPTETIQFKKIDLNYFSKMVL
jgi:restriction system protein